MKELYTKHQVPTSPYVVMTEWDGGAAFTKSGLTFPVLVKVSSDACSTNLQKDSKCATLAEVEQAIKKRKAKIPSAVFVIEQFIEGPEFTVSVHGNYNHGKVEALWPCEFVFTSALASEDQWIHTSHLYQRQKVADPIFAKTLSEIARAAYISNLGKGYARVDMRQDKKTGQIFVLETNAMAGLGYNRVTETILEYNNVRLQDFLQILVYHSKYFQQKAYLTQYYVKGF
eukprot:TRINITY_DN3388_c0_g1_i1.p3 TRINITY_DN3388_c0_g1~~TRINITY_DN3388_c0_g1_i1.p3  ORF type:complete len:229 (+),score=22.81 TRINITY_DN3388_c0_g1_i1:1531-2217(+)